MRALRVAALLVGLVACAKQGAPVSVAEVARSVDTPVAVWAPGIPLPGERAERTSPDPDHVDALLPVVHEVLAVYPPALLHERVGHVWLVGRLRVQGRPWLGLAHPKIPCLEVALRSGTDPMALRRTMHHEIAHLVAAGRGFDADRWRAFSAGAYVGRGAQDAWGPGQPWLREGFVTRYASVNPAEDFAELAEAAFTRPRTVRKLAGRYPRLADKLRYLSRLYLAVAPGIVLPWLREGDLERLSRAAVRPRPGSS